VPEEPDAVAGPTDATTAVVTRESTWSSHELMRTALLMRADEG
jgi:hypothetical protein